MKRYRFLPALVFAVLTAIFAISAGYFSDTERHSLGVSCGLLAGYFGLASFVAAMWADIR